MRKIIISVAPTSAADKNIVPQTLAAEVAECGAAGAAMVHMHVRNKNGELTADLSTFKEIVEAISTKSDIVIQASTGGVSQLTIQERCAPLSYNKVESTSLNVGSLNLGEAIYKNPIKEVEYCCEQIISSQKFPEVEVFELGMIETAKKLWKKLPLPTPALYNIVLGHDGGAPANIETLGAMVSFLPKDCLWGITHFGRKDFHLLTAGVTMGASLVRIGFEDSPYITKDLKAKSNLPLVKQLSRIILEIGYELATPEDLRKLIATGNRAVLNKQ